MGCDSLRTGQFLLQKILNKERATWGRATWGRTFFGTILRPPQWQTYTYDMMGRLLSTTSGNDTAYIGDMPVFAHLNKAK